MSDGVWGSVAVDWEAQYERDFDAQRSSGPFVFTEEERRKNRELLSRLRDLLPFSDAYKVSDCDLMYRFLIGNHWSLSAAERGMRNYVQLRKANHLDSIIGEQLHPTICSVLSPIHKGAPCPVYGLDKEGLPVLWLSPDASKLVSAMKEFTSEQLLRGQLRSMELGRYACLQRKVDRCTYVINLGGITMSSVNKATLTLLKGVMSLLQVAYPEIMRRLLIFNTGWAVSAAWKVLRPLVDARVQDKIKFDSGPPTLASLQLYIEADQVHPSFGGTGLVNTLDPIIEVEVRRIRRGLEGPVSSAPATATRLAIRGPSTESHQNASLLSPDALTLCSIHSASPPSTLCPSPMESLSFASQSQTEERERVVIGMPSAVSAWLAKTNADSRPTAALDTSPSVASSSDEYAYGKEEVSSTFATDRASGCADGDGAALLSLRGSSASGTAASSRESAPMHAVVGVESTAEQQAELPAVGISLAYGADGSISGYCGQQWVGRFRQGRLYAPDMNGTDAASSSLFPCLLPAPPSSVAPGRAERNAGVPAGELLTEAGHPLHNFFMVCDGQRRARYLLRESRLRTRLTIYSVVGDPVVHTEKDKQHYIEGERAKLGVVVPHANAASCGGKGAWMLYGEDVTRRSSRKPMLPLRQLFSKTKPAVRAAESSGGGGQPTKGQRSRWPRSIFTALRSGADSTSKRWSKLTASAASGPAGVSPPGPPDHSPQKSSAAADDGTQLLAECKGQTVIFYHFLTKSSLFDLFALAVAITQSWSNEMDEYKSKTAPS
ncbi:hypothetical protein LSCM1_00368 [Leishmania martiniquensis]|uniref:CRAL-TRIO domain-containing protein n=1 Tax=Leishmania martiniquensis TaxID=1580590 RepID=A0A836GU58_9TRYP|nr:hypothetical protein LSCM1_00368 [Leishmania martiniquensis]